MTFTKVTLQNDERVIRLIKRPPSEAGLMPTFGLQDFDRVMHLHSGISIWRARAKAIAMNAWPVRNQAKGILIAPAGPVQALGLVFYEITPDHFSVRCNGCNLSQNQRQQMPLCAVVGGVCEFAPQQFQVAPTTSPTWEPAGIREKLAPLFSVDTVPLLV